MAISIQRFFVTLRFALNDNYLDNKKIKNESEIPHSERSEESPFLDSQ